MIVDTKLAYGMITAKAITNARGGVLLPSGIELSEPILLALMKQGIQRIEVVEKNERQQEIMEEQKKQQQLYIEQLFSRFHSPEMMEFKACLINQMKK